MLRPPKKKSTESIPVYSSRPGDLYIRVSDLLRNKDAQEQIRKMAEIAEAGETRGKRGPTTP